MTTIIAMFFKVKKVKDTTDPSRKDPRTQKSKEEAKIMNRWYKISNHTMLEKLCNIEGGQRFPSIQKT